ncbi:MAG TPA: lysophospholipid acyltransferase family protein [Acidimicrobiales bacterium]|nr:lysophospholipid acyltransferase family protein [Acidimicrobiales bacterium]
MGLGLDYPTAWGRGYLARAVRDLFHRYLLAPYARYLSTLEVRGLEYLQGEGPFIFAANHVSHVDTILVLTALPDRLRRRTVVAAAMDSFFMSRSTAFRTVLAFNAIPVDRLKVNRRSAQLALELVQDGWNLLIYPEGGRSPDGRLQEFKGGAAYLAERSRTCVVPTYIHESGWLKGPRYAKAPLYTEAPSQGRHHVVVAFGEPLRCGEDENMRRFGTRVEEAVARLGREVSGDPDYGVARPDTDAPDEDTGPGA